MIIDKRELEEFETKWKIIDDQGLKKVIEYSKHPEDSSKFEIPKNEYLQLYSIVYEILLSKNQEVRKLCYQRLTSTIKYECERLYEEINANLSVMTFIDKWEIFDNILVKWTLKIFSYLSRIKLLVQKDSSLDKEIREIFKKEVYMKLSFKLKENYLNILESFRKGQIEPDLGKLKMFILFLDYFQDNEFQEEIIKKTQEYYTNLSKEKYSNSYLNYFEFGKNVIQFESTNLMLILPSLTVSTIISSLNEIIFFTNAKELLEMDDGFYYLLDNHDVANLKYTFGIFTRSEKTQHILLDIFKRFINDKFKNIINKFKLDTDNIHYTSLQVINNTNYFGEYSDFQIKINDLIEQSFMKNNLFYVAFKEVLEDIQSKLNIINISYLLPVYFDKFLRKSNGLFTSKSDAENYIDKGLIVFPYITEKDVFISLHRSLLSDRILNHEVASLEAESYLLQKLKEKCGDEYITNIETMIKDSETNGDFNQEFQIYYDNLNKENPKLNILENSFIVLTAENWPSLSINSIKLPPELVNLKEIMVKFYDSKVAGRVLKFSFHNSLMEIEGKFLNGKVYTFICNTFQGCILCYFNKYSFNNPINEVKIVKDLEFQNENDFNESIVPLVNIGVLIETKDAVNGGRSFLLNHKFDSNNKLNSIIKLFEHIGEEDNKIIIKKEKIDLDRSMAIDGTIIHIMKDKKQCEHDLLIKSVMEYLDRFKVDIEAVKKRIDSLISKELISRDKTNPQIYVYLANNPTESNEQ